MRSQRTVHIDGRPGREPRHISYGESALRRELADLDPLSGQRLHDLYVASLKMGSLIAGDEIFRERVEAMLTTAGRMTLHLLARNVAKTVRKGLDAGMRSPRGAPAWATVRDRNDAILRWFDWFEQLAPEDFPGTKGSTLLRLFAGFAIVGITVGKIDIRWSIRQAAEGAGLSRNTVHNLLKAGGLAERSGYLRPARRRARPGDIDSRSATTWHPIIKRGFARQDGGIDTGTKSLSRKTSLRGPDPNIFHRRANAWRIHGLLADDEEVTVAQIATSTGLTPATVLDNLQYLGKHRFAFRIDRTTWRGTRAALDKSAPAPDGVDYASGRRMKHAEERDQYALWRAARLAQMSLGVEDQQLRSRTSGGGCGPDERVPIFDPQTGEILEVMPTRGPDLPPSAPPCIAPSVPHEPRTGAGRAEHFAKSARSASA